MYTLWFRQAGNNLYGMVRLFQKNQHNLLQSDWLHNAFTSDWLGSRYNEEKSYQSSTRSITVNERLQEMEVGKFLVGPSPPQPIFLASKYLWVKLLEGEKAPADTCHALLFCTYSEAYRGALVSRVCRVSSWYNISGIMTSLEEWGPAAEARTILTEPWLQDLACTEGPAMAAAAISGRQGGAWETADTTGRLLPKLGL